MESKEFLLKKYEALIKRLLLDECFIMPHNVHVDLWNGSTKYPDEFVIEVKIPSGFVLFPTDLDKVEDLRLRTLSLSGDKNFYNLIYLCK